MPIPRELRHLYRTPQYLAAKAEVRKRSGGQCEECSKPDRMTVRTRTGGGRMIWRPLDSLTWRDESGWPLRLEDLHGLLDVIGPIRQIRVVIVPAHLNHTPGDDRPENLRDLCQWHHLMLDRGHHKQTRSRHKDERRPLLQAGLALPDATSPDRVRSAVEPPRC